MISLVFQPLTTAGDVFVSDVELGGMFMYMIRRTDAGLFEAVCTEDDCVISTHRTFDKAADACTRDYTDIAVVA